LNSRATKNPFAARWYAAFSQDSVAATTQQDTEQKCCEQTQTNKETVEKQGLATHAEKSAASGRLGERSQPWK
jgi:hypothetical protein